MPVVTIYPNGAPPAALAPGYLIDLFRSDVDLDELFGLEVDDFERTEPDSQDD